MSNKEGTPYVEPRETVANGLAIMYDTARLRGLGKTMASIGDRRAPVATLRVTAPTEGMTLNAEQVEALRQARDSVLMAYRCGTGLAAGSTIAHLHDALAPFPPVEWKSRRERIKASIGDIIMDTGDTAPKTLDELTERIIDRVNAGQ